MLALVVSVLLWASAFPAIRVALVAYPPVEIAFLRYFLASAVLGIYAWVVRMPMPLLRDLPAIALYGFLGFSLYNVALNIGEQTISAGTASFVISAEVGLIALLARLWFDERLRIVGWVGVALCVAGVGAISLGAGGGVQLSLGVVWVFVATLSISVYTVAQKPLLQRYSAIQFTAYAIWAGTAFLLVFSPGAFQSLPSASLPSTLAIAYMGLFPGAIAYIAWSYVLSQMPAARAGSFLALIPVATLAIAWLWLREVPTGAALLGGAIVFCGVMLVNRRSGEAIASPPPN
jgi:drug/metabolite transporter (DMT)-like permease